MYDKVLELNPDFKPQEFSPVEKREESDLLAKLAKRDRVVCSNFPGTQRSRVYEGIKYLKSLKGRPWIGPGPGKCMRVSCGYDAAIWWCNDVSFFLRFLMYNEWNANTFRNTEQGNQDPP